MNATDTPNRNKSWLKKYIQYLSSSEGQRTIIMIVTLIFVTLILCSKYFSFNAVINEDGIAKQDVIANKTVEVIDKEATEQKKNEAKDKVKPVYKPVEGNVDDIMTKDLQESLDIIDKIRDKLHKERKKQVNLNEVIKDNNLQYVPKHVLKYLLIDSTNYNWNDIQSLSQEILKRILNNGISSRDLNEHEINLIRSYFSRSIPEANQEAIIILVSNAVNQPNIVVDQQSTEMAQKNAMDVVDNVKIYFKKGQIIVEKGKKATQNEVDALKKLGYTVSKLDSLVMFGILCFVIIALYIVWYYLSRYDPKYANSPRYLALIATMTIIALIFLRIIPDLPRVFSIEYPVYIFPLAAITLIISFFTNSRVSLLVTFLIIFLTSVVLRYPVDDIVVMAVGSIVAVFKSSKMNYYRDFSLIETGIAVGLAQVLVVLSNYLITNVTYSEGDAHEIILKCLIALVSGLLTGALTIAAMPYLELIFNIVTSHGLMELADQNQPLLRRLQFEAPGTYHHSLMLSTLAEAAAEAIGASTILVRVGAFYHDIGKLKRPSFFIENQSYFGTENPHDKLNPRLSKMVLAAHAKDGLELAKQYNLPRPIQDMIIEHHGDGIMLYFYRAALELEGPDKVLKDQFRYMGPKPSTKESAIIMLADATESAVRSLKNPSISTIEEKIMKIIDERLEDDQLSETPLTLKDIKVISSTFVRVLRGMQHHRIEYHETILEELHKKHNEQNKEKNGKSKQNGNNNVEKQDVQQDEVNQAQSGELSKTQ